MQTGTDTAVSLPQLRLKKNEDRRLKAGHVWVFSNEVDTAKTPLTGMQPGQSIEIVSSQGKFIGYGYVNPHSLICARLLSRKKDRLPGPELVRDRIKAALQLRERIFPNPYYRMVYGESDLLPGLVVDRYADVLVVQITTAGMEQMLDDILSILKELLAPQVIYLRNDGAIREMEGLDTYVRLVEGELPEAVSLEENGVNFQAPLGGGQKTGWFYDHRDNRSRLGRYVQGMRVLDLFSYIGGWGIQAAVSGAKEVVCVDASHTALEWVRKNAELNEVQSATSTLHGDAFEVLKQLREQGKQFDVVILDPPAFIKRRKDQKKGVEAYQRLNEQAMRLLVDDGILVSASCSFHLQGDELKRILLRASRQLGKNLSILEQGGQGPDHPVHPAIPETAYLKAFFCRVRQ